MKFLDRMERRFGHWAVPNAVATLIIAQIFIYGMVLIGRVDYGSLLLEPAAMLQKGEWWRLLSFLIAPPYIAVTAFSAIFLAFFWYIFWMMSSALEASWGVFRFNVFIVAGIFFTLVGAFLGHWISPDAGIVTSPRFLYLTVFLAFATLNPNFEFLLMFIIPMKVKWLAWLFGAFTVLAFVFAPTIGDRIAILGSVMNYLLFFRDAMTQSVKSRKRRNAFQREKQALDEKAFHVCSVCGATDKTHPERGFRYKTEGGKTVAICDVCREEAQKDE